MSRHLGRWWLVGAALAWPFPLTPLRAGERPPAPGFVLRWGGDKSGGAPYLIENADGSLQGFEVELADYLGARLGRRAEFVNGQWSQLPDLLTRGDVDLVLNGYEWSPEMERRWAATLPYYRYRLQLLSRRADDSIRSWDDLRPGPGRPGKCVGVLRGSAAERYLQEHFAPGVEVRSYDGVTDVMDLVDKAQELDATVQDTPVALYYGSRYPGLHGVGEPVEPNYYVGYVRRDDTALRDQVNEAIRQGLRDGTLRRLYEKYGVWNADQEGLAGVAEGPWPPPLAPEAPGTRWADLPRYALTLLQAAGVTVLLSCLSMPLAMLLGLLVAVGRLYGPGWLARPLAAYVEFLRGTPLLLQLYVLYFLLPNIGIRLPAFWAGVLGLAVNYSAYEAENYRAGFLAIPRGQLEAALALGMSTRTALRRVLIPQAVRIVIPPVTNDFIALFKDTSVCSVIAVTELTGRYYQLYNNNRGLVLELGLLAGLLYLLMSYPLALVARRLERRFPRVLV